MKSQSKNRFKKIHHHLKSKQIDEKLELLSEIPTNNISNLYVVEPDYYVQDPDIPGEVTREVNFAQDALANGRDTTGLFDDNGTILTIEPPGDTSYILGPMASMWYAWGNFSTIGYIRQADRRMVDLGRITGRLGSWNGSSGFTSYGQLTLEQAVWFRDTPKLNGADNNTPNYRAFYPGPPSNAPDQYGRYLCVITGTPKPVGYKPPERRVLPVLGGPDPNLVPGLAKPKSKSKTKPSPKDADYAAYKAGGGDAAVKGGKSVEEVIAQGKANLGAYDSGPRKTTMSLSDFKSAADYSAYKAGGGDAAVKSGKTVQQVIAQGKVNVGGYDSGSKISDPYKLSSSEKNYLNNIAKTQGAVAARDAQINIEISKLQKLDSAGKLSPQQKLDLIALQANVGLKKASDYAKVASDVLDTVMLAKSAGQLAGKGISAGVSAAVKAGAPKGLSSAGLKVGATGVNKSGFDALTKGDPFKASTKPQILGQGAYQAPKVGTTGGVGGGTGAARYAGSQGSLGGGQQPGGVVGSLTPKGSSRIPIIEPQSKVPTTTFDKGARIVRDVQSGKYPTSAKAQQIQQQLGAAGFPKGQSSIPYSQLPTTQAPSASSILKGGSAAGTIAALTQLQGSTPQSGPGSNQAKIQQAIDNPNIKNLGVTNYSAFKAGGGEAALNQQGKTPEALANIIAQGKQNISQYGTTKQPTTSSSTKTTLGAAAAAGALLGKIKINPSWSVQQAANAVSNVSDYGSLITDPKVGLGKGYSFTDWVSSNEGLKATLLKDGKPVMGTDGKPLYMTAPGTDKSGTFTSHGKSQQTAGNNYRKIVNQVKNMTPATETGVTVTRTPVAKPGGVAKTKYINYASGSGPKPQSGTPSNFKSWSQIIDDAGKSAGKVTKVTKILKLSHEMQGNLLMENRQRIIRDLKKPVVLPEEKKEKIKHRPRVIGAPPKTINSDLMKKAEVPSSYIKPEERLWGKYEKNQNARLSQERKNEVLDHLGGSDHAWEWLTETSRKKNEDIMYGHFGGDKKKKVVRKEEIKGDTLLLIVDENGKKENILQSELSIKLADEFNKELFEKYFQEQETLQADKDPLFRRVSKKLKTEIDYPDKPSKAGYPDVPPPEMINGWHPEYGQDKMYYNKLDPHSANSMPTTGNAEIDTKVSKAKRIKNIIKGS